MSVIIINHRGLHKSYSRTIFSIDSFLWTKRRQRKTTRIAHKNCDNARVFHEVSFSNVEFREKLIAKTTRVVSPKVTLLVHSYFIFLVSFNPPSSETRSRPYEVEISQESEGERSGFSPPVATYPMLSIRRISHSRRTSSPLE